MSFAQRDRVVTLAGRFDGLPPGPRGIQIREHGDCGGKGAARAGADFNPTDSRHGPPESPQRHAGDFGNVEVDDSGQATFAMQTDSVTVEAGPNSIVGRSVVITARPDDGVTQPSGNAGPAIACGIIRLPATVSR